MELAVVGLFTAILVVVVGNWQQSRNEHARWLRDQRQVRSDRVGRVTGRVTGPQNHGKRQTGEYATD